MPIGYESPPPFPAPPVSTTKHNKLFAAIKTSYRNLEPFRNQTRALVKEYAGSGYGGQGPDQEVLFNIMHQAVEAYILSLVANRPRVMLSTAIPGQMYFCKKFELALNKYLEEIRVAETFRKWVLDAYFGCGITKLHLADSGYVITEGDMFADPGYGFVSNISIDNFVIDMGATRDGEVKFAADMYRLPFADLKQDCFNQEVVKDLVPTSKNAQDSDRLEKFSRGDEVDEDEYEPMIDLTDVWCPRDRMIRTFAVDNRETFMLKGAPLAELPWDYDDIGPYRKLGFIGVPENIMPSSLAAQIFPMAQLFNNLLRKQAKQAKRQKSLTTYTPGGEKSAERAQKARDGELIEVQDVNELGSLRFGGVDAGNQAFAQNILGLFDRAAGNLTAILGLGSQSGTVGQEELIHGAAGKKIAAMQFQVVDACAGVIRVLAKMLWDDPVKAIPGKMQVPGASAEYSVDASWTPDDRHGNFDDYQVAIDIYSMPYQSPSQKINTVNQLLTNVYIPLLPAIQQQGGTFNFQKLLELHANYLSTPELSELFDFVNPATGPSEDMASAPDVTPKPNSTTREYVRRNVSATNPQDAQQQAWLAMANSGSEQAAPAMQ